MKHALAIQIGVTLVAAAVFVPAPKAKGGSQEENLLVSAGFQVQTAQTVSQRQELGTLPKGKISLVMQNGKAFYVYPDAQRNEIYVGDEAEYQTYLDELTLGGSMVDQVVDTDYTAGKPVKSREFHAWAPFDGITE